MKLLPPKKPLTSLIIGSCAALVPQISHGEAIPGVSQPYCVNQSQTGLNHCAERWYQVSEYLYQMVYEDTETMLMATGKVALQQVDETWRRYRARHCDALSQPFEANSMYSMLFYNCLAQLTNDRIADLQQWSTENSDDSHSTGRIQELVSAGQMAENQALWEAYLEAHCQFEATLPDPLLDQSEPCRTRLNHHRVTHLEAFIAPR